jgi:hypothetical protein
MRRPHLLPVVVVGALIVSCLSACVPSANAIDVQIVALSPGDVPTVEPGQYGSTVLDTFDDLALLLPALARLRDQVDASDQDFGTGLVADPVFAVAPDGSAGTARAGDIDAGAALAGGTFVSLVGLANDSSSVSDLGVGEAYSSDDGTMVVTRGESNAEISTQKTTTEKDGELSVTSHFAVAVEGTLCPDNDGNFDFTIKVRSESVGTGPSETASALQELEVHVTGRLGANAQPESITVDGLQNASEVNPAGEQVTVSSRQTYSGGGEAVFGLPTVAPELVSKSDGATSDDVKRLAKRGGDRLASIAYSAILAAMTLWSDGGCVRIVAPAPGTVKPHGTGSIAVKTEGKVQHDSFPAPVDLALSGPDKIDKQNLTSEATVTWTAGDAGSKASLTLTTKSRRGGATLTVPLVPGGKPYYGHGGAGDLDISGQICDLNLPFTMQGGGVTMTFTPTSEAGGNYEYSGSLQGFGVQGTGTYTVTYDGDVAMAIDGFGPGSVEGAGSATGSEHYTLEPISACG